MYKPNGSANGHLFGAGAVLIVVAMLTGACGTASSPAGSSNPASPGSSVAFSTSPGASGSLSVGPVDNHQLTIDPTADFSLALATSEDAERGRARDQARFGAAFGSGWAALSQSAEAATDAAAAAMAAEFEIALPITSRNAQFASVVAPDRNAAGNPASAAAGLALLGAALAASQALGVGGTLEPVVSESNTTTQGDSVATVTVNGEGTATSSGSRVTAQFSFDLVGSVSNIATGATATMTGSATARIEIDGCPDASGSTRGKVSLSSSESASNGIGWSRNVAGDFDITVDDEANISNLTVDADADESVDPGTQDGEETDGHELGIRTHVEFSAGPGFGGMEHNGPALGLEITHENDATREDLLPLFTSALTAVVAGAHILGQAAEAYWRDGKCIEVIVTPAGEEVDANSTTEVVVKVKHRIEGNELNKPVEATLAGLKSIEPAGQKVPAPATFTYTAGPAHNDKGDIEFKSVSNRGIGKKSVTFTVRAIGWITNATSPLGEITGVKCDGLGGDWIIDGVENLGVLVITTRVVVSINIATLAGTFHYHKDQVGAGTLTTHDSRGAARVVLNEEDGSVMMTLDAAPITLVTTNSFGGSGSATVQGDELRYPWTPASAEDCS